MYFIGISTDGLEADALGGMEERAGKERARHEGVMDLITRRLRALQVS